MHRFKIIGALTAVLCNGCGGFVRTSFTHAVSGADGEQLVLDDIEAIVGDNGLSDDDKRGRLRELGIEDDELIEALLAL